MIIILIWLGICIFFYHWLAELWLDRFYIQRFYDFRGMGPVITLEYRQQLFFQFLANSIRCNIAWIDWVCFGTLYHRIMHQLHLESKIN